MAAGPSSQSSLAENSRCDDRVSLAGEEQNVDHAADRADASIAEKINRALWNNSVLRRTDYREIDIVVKDRIVFLSGHVNGATNQHQAEDEARKIPGVLDVKNYLVSDDKIIREVSGALGKIEHDYGVKFFTGARNGVVALNGEVSSTNLRSLAEKCAANVPGVRGVINYIRCPNVDLLIEDQRFLQPIIGVQIYFSDGLLGTVQRVIIHPNNRRVVAMIVQRPISTPQSGIGSLISSKTFLPEGLVVILMKFIRYMTKDSGSLHIYSTETTKYRDFDPALYVAPEQGWPPPFPYCLQDILFPVESVEAIGQIEN